MEDVNITEALVKIPKKGRPKKIIVESDKPIEPVEPKKRGRKRKEVVDTGPKIKLKRGRKACVKYFSSSIRKKMPLTTSLQDNDKYILHLDITEPETIKDQEFNFKNINNDIDDTDTLPNQLSKIFNYDKTKTDSSEIENILEELSLTNSKKDIIELYEKRIESRTDEDKFLINKLETLNTDEIFFKSLINNTEKLNETISKKDNKNSNIECRKKGFFKLFNDFIENDSWLHLTDISCWWCCHQFDTVPIGIPIKYNIKTSKFTVKGIFCSFGCLASYNDQTKIGKISLIKFLYFKLTSILHTTSKDEYRENLSNSLSLEIFDNDQDLKNDYINGLLNLSQDILQRAPPKCCLKIFGGDLSIEEFRNSFKEHHIYKMIEYPMSISRDYIEEVDIQNVKNINKNVFNTINSFQHSTNILDDKKIEETHTRIKNISNSKSNVVVSNNSIDRFLSY